MTGQDSSDPACADKTFVIVGGGQAAAQAVQSLRQEGFEGRIVLVGDEPFVPYQRPPLSKKFLAGELPLERLYVKPQDAYGEARVDLKLRDRVTAIDREARSLRLQSGETLGYDKLLLATGSRVREMPVPGIDLDGVHYLRSIEDVQAIQPHFEPGKRLVVVGGGYIGLETAAVALKRGLKVTVLEMADRVMARVTAPVMSEFFTRIHRREGVDIRCGTRVEAFAGEDGRLSKVVCADGSEIDADVAIVGIGILPNVELAQACGLPCDNGILVSEYCQTADPHIFAAGDCTNHPSDMVGRRIRLESVQNALEQGKTAAAAMVGKHKPYNEVPWFWSDQYDLKLQIAGLSEGHDDCVVRGDPESRQLAAFYLKEGRVIAVDAVNSVPEFMIGKKLIAAHALVPPETLADTGVSMKDIGRDYA